MPRTRGCQTSRCRSIGEEWDGNGRSQEGEPVFARGKRCSKGTRAPMRARGIATGGQTSIPRPLHRLGQVLSLHEVVDTPDAAHWGPVYSSKDNPVFQHDDGSVRAIQVHTNLLSNPLSCPERRRGGGGGFSVLRPSDEPLALRSDFGKPIEDIHAAAQSAADSYSLTRYTRRVRNGSVAHFK